MYNTLMQALPSLSADVIYGWFLMWIGLSYPIMNTMIERRSKGERERGDVSHFSWKYFNKM